MIKTNFLTITAAEQESIAARAIVGREREIYSYESNIEHYEKTLAAGGLSPAFEQRLKDLLVTENAERDKTVAIYKIALTQIAPGRLVAALASAKDTLPPL